MSVGGEKAIKIAAYLGWSGLELSASQSEKTTSELALRVFLLFLLLAAGPALMNRINHHLIFYFCSTDLVEFVPRPNPQVRSSSRNWAQRLSLPRMEDT